MSKTFDNQWKLFSTYNSSAAYLNLQYLESISFEYFNKIKGKTIVELGSGDGRIVEMLIAAQASKVISIETTETGRKSQEVKFKNENVLILESLEQLVASNLDYDSLICIGVLHHQKNPSVFFSEVIKSTKKNIDYLFWVYAKKSYLYILVLKSIRIFTILMPSEFSLQISSILEFLSRPYIRLARKIRYLPLHKYVKSQFGKLGSYERKLLIYDQLTPRYAKYFDESEIKTLLETNRINNYRIYTANGSGFSVLFSR